MRILMIHNEYARTSGEEVQFHAIAELLAQHGYDVTTYLRSSAELKPLIGPVHAFFAGLYSPRSCRDIRQIMHQKRPHIVFIQNLYPLISPAILPIIRSFNVPIVMRVANYRLMCPNGLHLCRQHVCEKCLTSSELACLWHNCESSIFKSAGYALRSYLAHKRRWYRDNVTAYISATNFLRQRMINADFPAQDIHVIPNVVSQAALSAPLSPATSLGHYIAYVGRVSEEKGIDTFIQAARLLPNIPFHVYGHASSAQQNHYAAPPNVHWMGFIPPDQLLQVYQQCRILVFPSRCYETFGMSLAEAMLQAKPVIASDIGVLSELVQPNQTGLLVPPANPQALANAMNTLYHDRTQAQAFGRNARQHIMKHYHPQVYYTKLHNLLTRLVLSP